MTAVGQKETASNQGAKEGLGRAAPDLALRAELAQHMVAVALGVPPAEIKAATRRRAPVAFARQVAMYLTHVAYGYSLSQVAAAFGRDRTTASHACHVVEDRRDDPRFDMLLTGLERGLRSVPMAEPSFLPSATAAGRRMARHAY